MRRPPLPLVRFLLGAVALAAWLSIPFTMPGRLSVFVTITFYILIVVGLSLLAGYAGQVSLGQAAFYGLGAYATGVLTANFGWSPWLSIPAAILGTAALAYVVGMPVFLLRGHYLVIATLGFGIIVQVLMRQQRALTGGASGLIGIPSLQVGEDLLLVGDEFYFYTATVLALVGMGLSRSLVLSRFGRALQAIQSSEAAAGTLGVNGTRYKTAVFAWSAGLAALAGVLYAHWVGFVSPSPYGLGFSVLLLVMAVVGGIASIPGAVVGVVVVELLRDWLRDVVPRLVGAGGSSAEYEIVVFGVLLAIIVLFAPEGVWPRIARVARGLPWFRAGDRGDAGVEAIEPEFPAEKDAAPVLEVTDLTRRFGGLIAVSGLSLEVAAGEVFAVIGPNGAGKTTLLNLISGVLTPTEGEIRVSEREVSGTPAHRIAMCGVARTFQTPHLFPLLDVLDNVKVGVHRRTHSGFVRCALGLDRSEERRATSEALGAMRMVGIEHLAGQRVDELPFGGQRLVELARALASRPRLLLLDEPASGLTASERQSLVEIIRKIAAAGVAVILVEHNVRLVSEIADRVIVIHHGERIAYDTPDVVMQDERVISAYLGEAAETERHPAPAGTSGDRQQLLSVRALDAGYGAIHVLHDVSLDLFREEAVAVLGRNGAGKSTLTKAIAGLLPSDGRVELEGQSISGLPADRVTSLGMSLVPERRQLFDTLTVADHLQLGAYRRRAEGQSVVDHGIESVLDLFPILRERASQKARSLSGGQQQMLAIGRALMANPKVLVLDEPLLGLAPKIVEDILVTIDRLRSEGIGILVVEQNASAVLRIADRGYVLENGSVVLSGGADELLGNPELRAAFLGEDIREEQEAVEKA